MLRTSTSLLPSACALLALATPAHAQERPRVEALRIDEEVRVDGRLDEPFWDRAEVARGFVQREPVPGAAATEPTEVRVAFDDSHLYIAILARDSRPDAIVAREMARDGTGGGGRFGTGTGALTDDDQIAIVLDTFHDGRNAFFFETNPLGARADGLIEDEGRPSFEWDGVWHVGTSRGPDGWIAELSIPFSTLRLDPSTDVWGFNVQRLIRRKTEETLWAPVGLDASVSRISLAGELTGLTDLPRSLNLRVKPYVAASDARDFTDPDLELDDGFDAGLDLLRWGITGNLTLDLTANTDFAQVEADDQQVNLTRFSLFFPEKREFFLENAGIFAFGPGGGGGGGFGGPSLQMFFSRRIGLDGGEVVPMQAGARLTGRTDDWSFGLLDVQTGAHDPLDAERVPRTNWGVARIKRNLGDRSTVGAIFTNRQAADAWNRVIGIDADINPSQKWNFNGFFALSDDAVEGTGWTGGAGFDYRGTIWRANAAVQDLREEFEPGIGFLPRKGIRRYNYSVDFEPRPDLGPAIRNLSFNSRTTLVTSTEGTVESVDSSLRFLGADFSSGDRVTIFGGYNFERLEEPFEIVDGVTIPTGEYDWTQIGLFVQSSGARPVSVFGFWEYGGFYGGTRLNGRSRLTLRLNRHLAMESNWNYNDADLPWGEFTTHVVQQKVRVAFSTDLFWSTFVQRNTAADLITVNSRLNWIYRPGADLFLVYNQDWDTSENNRPGNRALILKFTYLFTL